MNRNNTFLYLLGTISIVFLVYFSSLFRPWQPFDERFLYQEELLPIPTSFNEIPEIINRFALNAHVLSMNSFFSNYATLRSNPITFALIVLTSFFFQKNVFLYHSLQLLIHLLNVILIWFIFNKTLNILDNFLNDRKLNTGSKNLIASLFTCIWALHSANTEATLLVTNWTALLTYSFCFSFILYEVSQTIKDKRTTKGPIFISILFCLLMFLTEYAYTLPLILFFIIFSFAYLHTKSFNQSTLITIQRCLPYFLGLFFFILLSLFNPNSTITNLFSIHQTTPSLHTFFERNLWLVPQVFIHFLKLLIFPKTLSAYQSNLTHLSNTLLEPYSVFCTLFYLLFLLAPIALFVILKRNSYVFTYPLLYSFYFSLFPFLHIITPTYCLSADRYCYFPSFIFLFFSLSIFNLLLKRFNLKSMILLLACLSLVLTTRTLIRIQEWNNPVSFYLSAISAEKKSLYKGQKLLLFADFLNTQNLESKMQEPLQESLAKFKNALKELKILKTKYPNQPHTLRLYGLDYSSLILKAAHGISIVKKSYLKKPVIEVIAFFEPYISKRLDDSAPNEIAFYAQILLEGGNLEQAKEVYEFGYKKYPYSLDITLPLADYYLQYEKDFNKTFQILQQAYYYYPNKGMPIYKLLKYYEQKKDLENEAKFAYLRGLRNHSTESYQHAAHLYLDLNKFALAKKTLEKLTRLASNDPKTLLLVSRYLDLTGDRGKILELLNKAYLLNKSLGSKQELNVTKTILISLINVNYHLGDLTSAKQYLQEFEVIKDLSLVEKKQLQELKSKIETK